MNEIFRSGKFRIVETADKFGRPEYIVQRLKWFKWVRDSWTWYTKNGAVERLYKLRNEH